MSASSSTTPPLVWNVSVKPLPLLLDRLEAMAALDLRLEPLRQLVDDALVAAADLVALVALAEQRQLARVLEVAGADQEDEVQRRLLAGIEAVLGDVGDFEQLAHPAGRADLVEVLRHRHAVERGAAAFGLVVDDLAQRVVVLEDPLGQRHERRAPPGPACSGGR